MGCLAAAFAAGQLIFTPVDINPSALQVGDHPYAGWLYGAPSLERRGRTSGGTDVLEQIRLGLGWVGPGALGGEAQNFIHRNFQINQAQGWDNQLHNEPTADFTLIKSIHSPITDPDRDLFGIGNQVCGTMVDGEWLSGPAID